MGISSEAKKAYNKWYCQLPHVKKRKAEYIRKRYNDDPLFKKKQNLSSKVHYAENRESFLAQQKLYNKHHKKQILAYQSEYWRKNKARLLEYQRERRKKLRMQAKVSKFVKDELNKPQEQSKNVLKNKVNRKSV